MNHIHGYFRGILFFVLCANVAFSEDSPVVPVPAQAKWTSLFEGIKSAQASTDSPRLQRVFAVQIDTAAEGISFFSTPKAEDGYESGKKETVRQRTNDFLEQHKLQVAINANFFVIPKDEKYATPGIADLQGLTISEGNVVSLPDKRCAAVFRVSKDGKVHIENVFDTDKDFSDMVTAVAGNTIVLRDGKTVPPSDADIHPRTLVGISQDKRYVIFLVVDGRREGHSDGAAYNETAQWLQYFGAWDGLNLDGGGSTTLVIQGKDGRPVIVNRPSDNAPRINGNSLGVRALPRCDSSLGRTD